MVSPDPDKVVSTGRCGHDRQIVPIRGEKVGGGDETHILPWYIISLGKRALMFRQAHYLN